MEVGNGGVPRQSGHQHLRTTAKARLVVRDDATDTDPQIGVEVVRVQIHRTARDPTDPPNRRIEEVVDQDLIASDHLGPDLALEFRGGRRPMRRRPHQDLHPLRAEPRRLELAQKGGQDPVRRRGARQIIHRHDRALATAAQFSEPRGPVWARESALDLGIRDLRSALRRTHLHPPPRRKIEPQAGLVVPGAERHLNRRCLAGRLDHVRPTPQPVPRRPTVGARKASATCRLSLEARRVSLGGSARPNETKSPRDCTGLFPRNSDAFATSPGGARKL